MKWIDLHRVSERHASDAQIASIRGDSQLSLSLYREAAAIELEALKGIGVDEPRSFGIVAVSAACLFIKAKQPEKAESVIHYALPFSFLSVFHRTKLRSILQSIWNEESKVAASTAFADGQVLVSVRGGDTVSGGAPADLILTRIQTVQNMFYRTVELMKNLPFRQKGPPSRQIQEDYRPWLFMSVPGSYQFVVAVQKPIQYSFVEDHIAGDEIVDRFLSIVKSATTEDSEAFVDAVPNKDYHSTLLKLSRNLAPAGPSVQSVELVAHGSVEPVKLTRQSRERITNKLRPIFESNVSKESVFSRDGVLRAVHLDRKWLEFVDGNGEVVKVQDLKDTVDDVIGPMVNHRVRVSWMIDTGTARRFLDIEELD